MNAKMKKELLNDIVTGLAVAACFAAIIPADAFAQLTSVANQASSNIMVPIVKFASYASYGMGTVGVVAGISDAKKHSENPSGNPLGKALGKLGAGGAFLAAPGVAGMLSTTSSSTGLTGTATFNTIGGL